eukprot:Awhi_evm1s14858
MKSVIALSSAFAVAYVSGQEAQIGGERPDDVPRNFNQILGDFEPEDFIFDFRLVPVESMGIGGLVQPLSLGNAPVLALGNVAITLAGSLDVSVERAEELRDGLPLNI